MPPTAFVHNPYAPDFLVPPGPGMIQQHVAMKRIITADKFPEPQQKTVAIGHFLVGTGDGRAGSYHPLNHRDGRPDEPVVFDLGDSFYERLDSARRKNRYHIESDFVDLHAGQKFTDAEPESVDALTPDRLGAALEDGALSDNAIDLTLERLHFLQTTRVVVPII